MQKTDTDSNSHFCDSKSHFCQGVISRKGVRRANEDGLIYSIFLHAYGLIFFPVFLVYEPFGTPHAL